MALSFALPDVIARLKTYWNGSAWNVTSNPGGMARGGNQIGNFIAVLRDLAAFGEGITAVTDGAHADAAATAADRVQTGEDVIDADAARDKARDWANAPENTQVETGKYSGLHFAAKADASAGAAKTSEDRAKSYADAQSVPGVTSADAGKYLRVNADGSGYIFDTAAEVFRSARTANTQLVKTDRGKLIDVTSGTFTQTFSSAATLGNGWWIYLRNNGTGDITLDPNGSELIDGLSGFPVYPGETRLVTCDGAALRSVVLAPATKSFATSDNLIWPPGYSGAVVETTGGGGGGGYSASPNYAPGGGGGGGKDLVVIRKQPDGAVIPVTIGAGGKGGTSTTQATSGGSTSLGALARASGGLYPTAVGNNTSGAGGGAGFTGGSVSPGTQATGHLGGSSSTVSGGGADRGGAAGGAGGTSNGSTNGYPGGSSNTGAGGGGGGGAQNSSSGFPGGPGGPSAGLTGGDGGTGGGEGVAGKDVANGTGSGSGGGGGAGNPNGQGGKGGKGGFPGGGGGGGGAGNGNGGGDGGDGGDGFLRVRFF